jgi:hypothetical protein
MNTIHRNFIYIISQDDITGAIQKKAVENGLITENQKARNFSKKPLQVLLPILKFQYFQKRILTMKNNFLLKAKK